MRQLIDRLDADARLWRRRSAQARRPDYTRPVRMQVRGRDAADADRLRVKRLMWVQALADRAVWRRAGWLGLAAGAIQIALAQSAQALPSELTWPQVLRLAGILAATVGAAVCAAAGAQVRARSMRVTCERN